MGGASGDGHAATPAWDYEVVTIVVVIGGNIEGSDLLGRGW